MAKDCVRATTIIWRTKKTERHGQAQSFGTQPI